MKLKSNLSFKSVLQSYEAKYNCKYSDYQKKQLEFGYEDNLDISVYANPEFNYLQMNFIRNGLLRNLEVHKYAFVEYNEHLMDVIYRLLTSGANFDRYIKGEYLHLDKLMYDYRSLCRDTNLRPIDEWGVHYISNHAPYYVN